MIFLKYILSFLCKTAIMYPLLQADDKNRHQKAMSVYYIVLFKKLIDASYILW